MNSINFKINEKITTKKFLLENNFSKRAIKDILENGYFVNDDKVNKNFDLNINDSLIIPIEDEKIDYDKVKGELEIVYEDQNILVVNKAYNLTVNSKGQISLANYLAYYFSENNIKSKVRLVNRLDMNTSGLLMVAKNPYSMAYYQNQIEKILFKKNYLAVVEGKLDIDEIIKLNLAYNEDQKRYEVSKDGKTAITYFKTLTYDPSKDITYINADIKTGKTHQIRASLANLGYPILGDKLYGSKIKLGRFLLHAYKIQFIRFLDGKKIILESDPNFEKFLDSIKN
ncbi:RluA family pseudouridine synthase [Anaerococcus sp. Marseille-P9784]|uniref:RluA family pseudouridine synthase n=1 Tax=Anaerococcus sp. Marseille-P9784 TaxID=2614127 RepID=UPI00124AA884|nr:RluA family pseudouridine synthase [Anaerococcus sp. Marseille-P9784]